MLPVQRKFHTAKISAYTVYVIQHTYYVWGHKYSAFMPQIQDVHARKIPRSSHVSWLIDWPNLSRLLLLPWCMAIAGYHTSSDNSNSQQQPMAHYRQTSKFLQSASLPRRVKTTTNRINTWKFKYVCYANTIPTVLCTNNGLICATSFAFTIELSPHTSCEIWNNPLEFYDYYLVSRVYNREAYCSFSNKNLN